MTGALEGWRNAFDQVLRSDGIPHAWQRRWLGVLLAATLAIRLYTIGVPALDRTYWKEIDYIAISTNYWEHGFHFLSPAITWPAEGPRVTAMELPLVPFLASLTYPTLGVNPFSVRWVTLVSFLLLIGYVFLLARRELGPVVGLLSATAVAVLPLHNHFGRVLYSEPLMLAMSVMALYHFAEWVGAGKRRDAALALVGLSLAIALKLEPLYLLMPLGWIAFRTWRFQLSAYRQAALLVGLALILPLAWYAYALHLARTSIDVFGILGGHDKFQTITMLSDPEWYRIMTERVASRVLGGKVGTLLAATGVIAAVVLRHGGLFVAYLLAILCYFGIVAEGNIDAVYRQLHILPPIAVFVALGAVAGVVTMIRIVPALQRRLPSGAHLARAGAAGGALLILIVPGYQRSAVLGTDASLPTDPNRWELGQEIRKHATPGARLIAAGEYSIHVGGNDLSPKLYHYAQIQGWTVQSGQWSLAHVDSLSRRGATMFAASGMRREPQAEPFLRQLRERYPVLFEDSTKGLLLLDLRSPVAR